MYLLISTMIITVCCIPALAFMREDPPSPPSVVANDTDNEMKFLESLKELAKNWNYIKIFFVYLFISGINNSIATIYSNLASKFNYSLITISVGCLLSIFGGILFSFVIGVLLDKYQAYKRFQIFICGAAILGASYHTFSLPNGNAYLECVGMFMTGSTTITVCAVTFPFAVEVTFPI
jgi:Na+/melibiose symporter-like transporter